MYRQSPLICALVLSVAACSSRSDEDAAGFKPPVNVLRADLVAGFAKRFDRLDTDRNGTLDAIEIAKRPARIKMLDVNGDGIITLEEFKSGQLARFDQADVNRDGTLTTPERDAMKDERP
ncbi:hypothetical protein G4G27_20440 [Sphingomonas sp. So64.6b]|uniref:hypothetical protein n=1 Tax=Sphingomonas sp. So64.6b TaxID=2997354 RepID=UPI001600A40A|nr:hypothetical protein [Sphingomonas sp. So64.6b]QNA87131.1 hypothetical protein G4G27_20440 [Sphingomonas sp. So64.6b]